MELTSFADLVADKDRYRLYFTYINYDYNIRNMIYSTNWIERLNRNYKGKRTIEKYQIYNVRKRNLEGTSSKIS
ncbi:MAG: transposase [Bacteroidales bacterium]|nr:transposase [Bacteroidales bacterium]